jgi:DNA-binding CsgD family transcriptional regulator
VIAEKELLERDDELAVLHETLAGVDAGLDGAFVLVHGEAGVGKTALVRRFCREADARVLWAACEPLFTPRPLGPFLDLAQAADGELGELAPGGAVPYEVAAAVTGELDHDPAAILVIEDAHWADEATLDVLRLLGRRLSGLRALVVLTYRDDELERTHPLRTVLGELAATAAPSRIAVAPLSAPAVSLLAEGHPVDVDKLYRRTSGNPFFVSEILAAPGAKIPGSVRDAVLARVAQLSDSAAAVVQAASLMAPPIELELLQGVCGDDAAKLDECLSSGALVETPGGIAFRHELARMAIDDSLTRQRRLAVHRAALEALITAHQTEGNEARLAHHAEGAGDRERVLQFAPAAGERAATSGAHREAAAQYARALRFGEALSSAERAALLERRSRECYLTDQNQAAIDAIEEALECHRAVGNRLGEGAALVWLSLILWCPGRSAEAARAGAEAVAILEELPPGPELAAAWGNRAFTFLAAGRNHDALELAKRTADLADRVGGGETAVFARITAGEAQPFAEAWSALLECIDLARDGGYPNALANAMLTLVGTAVSEHRYDLPVEDYVEPAISHCVEHGLERDRLYVVSFAARIALDQGRLSEAAELADAVLRVRRTSISPRIHALEVLGLLRARRGDPGQWDALDEAWGLAEPTGELWRLGSVAAARAEAAWLAGDEAAVPDLTDETLRLAQELGWAPLVAELAVWRRRAGIEEDIPSQVDGPFALQLAGRIAEAESRWRRQRCPYEAALALVDSDSAELLRQAFGELQQLGAPAAAAALARRLREQGVRDLPRGPRASTQTNPAGLTSRELEVLELVAEGLRNAEIAERLVVSPRTVDHHVSTILRKLDVRTRAQAGAEAARLGIAAPR